MQNTRAAMPMIIIVEEPIYISLLFFYEVLDIDTLSIKTVWSPPIGFVE